MDEARLKAIYAELDTMRVPMVLPANPLPHMLMGMLEQCRRFQDRVLDLSTEVEKEKSAARKAVRAAQAAVSLSGGSTASNPHKEDLRRAQDTLDDVRALAEVLSVTRANLKVTDSDIRLGAQLIDQQMRLGNVRPPAPTAPSPQAANVPVEDVLKVFSPAPNTTPATPPPVPATTWSATPAPEPPKTSHGGMTVQQPVVSAEIEDISAFFSTPA